MRQLPVQMRLDIHFHLIPGAFVITDSFAGRTNGKESPEHCDIGEGILEFRFKALFFFFCRFTPANLLSQLPVPPPRVPGDRGQEKHHHGEEYIKPVGVMKI